MVAEAMEAGAAVVAAITAEARRTAVHKLLKTILFCPGPLIERALLLVQRRATPYLFAGYINQQHWALRVLPIR